MRTLLLTSAALLIAAGAYVHHAGAEPAIAKYLGSEPQSFPSETEAVEAFQKELLAKNVEGLAKIIGLNAAEVGKSEGFGERLEELQIAAEELTRTIDDGPDRRVIVLGELVWPFPFPLVKTGESWHFDTEAGLEEILDRRIGENELEAITTARNYILAQSRYETEDWDGDGVLEFAQVLKSPEGTKDGLYWPASDGVESPAGAFVDEARASNTEENGYFGYRYRILTKQGANVAGGAYDYMINGNMIAGFALIATPVRYGETGIKTFLVSHHGTVYEKDLGTDTETAAAQITEFNPDQSWEVVAD